MFIADNNLCLPKAVSKRAVQETDFYIKMKKAQLNVTKYKNLISFSYINNPVF